MHPGLSPQLGYFSTRGAKCFQFNVKRGHFNNFVQQVGTSYNSSPLFVHLCIRVFFVYSHRDHEGDVTIIPFATRIHQGDPLGGALFVLAHFKALSFIANHFLSCLFPSIIDDTHIIASFLIVSFTYEHFQIEFCVIGFSI